MELALLQSGAFLKMPNKAVSHSAKCRSCCYRTSSYEPNMSEASLRKWQADQLSRTDKALNEITNSKGSLSLH